MEMRSFNRALISHNYKICRFAPKKSLILQLNLHSWDEKLYILWPSIARFKEKVSENYLFQSVFDLGSAPSSVLFNTSKSANWQKNKHTFNNISKQNI